MPLEPLFAAIIKRPWLTVVLVLILVAAAGSGVRKLAFKNDYRMFFSKENPQLQAFEALQNTYTKNDNILFVLSPKNGDMFTRENLAAVEWLTKEAWQIPYSIRVDSLSNFQHTRAEEDDLIVEDLVEKAPTLTDAQLAEKKHIAVNEPLLRNRLVSPDGAYTGVNVTIQLQEKKPTEVLEAAAYARDLARQLTEKFPNIDVYLTGMVIMNNAFPEASQQDMKTLYPAMFLLILVLIGLMLRSIPGTLTTGLVILMTIVATLGLTGWAGIKLSPPTTSVPVVIMTLAVADCVHLLTTFLQGMRRGMDRATAMMESMRINLGPVFLTSITTAVGFMSLNFSDAPPFRDLGNMAATGVIIAFFLSIILLPAMMQILPIRATVGETNGSRTMEKLADFVIRQRNRLLWGMGFLVLGLAAMIPRNELNDQFVAYFDKSIQFRTDTDFATEHLTGIYLIEYSLPAKEAGGIADPEYLRYLAKFAEWYRQQPETLHVNTLSDTMKRLNKNLHGDDESWYRLPDQRDLSAQYLLLYEFSLPFGLDLNNQINVDKSATRMSVTLRTLTTKQLLSLEQRAQRWMESNLPDYMQTVGSSPSMMFAHIGSRNIRTMLTGTTVALVLISFILIVALRSLRLGLLSLLPNLVPITMAFGLWGIFNGQIGLALSIVSGMTLGIVVDDTVHFLSKYLRARREQGLDAQQAVRYAFKTVGTALWVTSVVLVLGFSVLAFSHFQLNAGMGLLTAITIACALLADFFFLPPLLIKFGDSKNV